MNETFQNPSQENNTPCGILFKCEKCDYATTTKANIVNHKKETHNWCRFCFSSFNSQDQLKDHILKNHTE